MGRFFECVCSSKMFEILLKESGVLYRCVSCGIEYTIDDITVEKEVKENESDVECIEYFSDNDSDQKVV